MNLREDVYSEEFSQKLSEKWLEAKEAKVYVALVMRGVLKASELARICSLTRMDVYRILRRLEAKGIVEAVLGRPMKFQAAPPEKAFDILLKSMSEKIASMKAEKDYILSLWPSGSIVEETVEGEKLRMIQGRSEFNNTLRRAVKSASRQISILTTKNGLLRLFHSGIDGDLEAKAEKGISIRILAKVDKSDLEVVQRFASIAQLRSLNSDLESQLMMIDGTQVIVSTALDDSMSLSSDKDASIWTNSRDHISLMQTLFTYLWDHSIDLNTALKVSEAGAEAPRYDRIVGQPRIISLEREGFEDAKKSVMILTPSVEASVLFKGDSLNLLKALREKGVDVKVATSLKEEATSTIKELMNYFALKITDYTPSIEIISIDGSTHILTKQPEKSQLLAEPEALYLTDQAYTSILNHFLTKAWDEAGQATTVLKSIDWVKGIDLTLNKAAESLTAKSFSVETPSLITGSSNSTYTFPFLARMGDDPRCVTVEYFEDETPSAAQKVMSYYAKAADCNVKRAILVVTPSFHEDAVKLADFFGIKTIVAASPDAAYQAIVDEVVANLS